MRSIILEMVPCVVFIIIKRKQAKEMIKQSLLFGLKAESELL